MQSSNRTYGNYQLVSVQVQTVGSRYYFPDLPQLRKVYTVGINNYNRFGSYTDKDGFVVSVMNSYALLTLVSNGEEVFRQIDCNKLVNISKNQSYSSHQGVFSIEPMVIDYSKSFVEISPAYGVHAAAPFCFLFGVFYEYPQNFTTVKPKMG